MHSNTVEKGKVGSEEFHNQLVVQRKTGQAECTYSDYTIYYIFCDQPCCSSQLYTVESTAARDSPVHQCCVPGSDNTQFRDVALGKGECG